MATSNGPNILFVVLDTVRKDRLSVYGHGQVDVADTRCLCRRCARLRARCRARIVDAPGVHASLFTGLGKLTQAPALAAALLSRVESHVFGLVAGSVTAPWVLFRN